ncbi:hypothetical protein N7457_006196 [Penicillium paradoxum]|uniref:uncharacterized protein n=1 Tax=Penicillium paradoxum TaxID=176176 RepID=UPI0025485DB5|nr:uncharacterized protein N7457_006196 [Penicillium paradoxum]KAJ5781036.1 hypothetical protein N7457_006196 [Penicillium paradoxum]
MLVDPAFPLFAVLTNVNRIASANAIRACQQCRYALNASFQITEVWWSTYCKRSNGYFGCETTLRQGKVSGINTWVYFEIKQLRPDTTYEWNKLNVFTRWLPSTKQTMVLLFDPKSPILETVPKLLLNPEASILGNAYWCYTKLLDTIADLEQVSVWAIRDEVRKIEKTEMTEPIPKPDWRRLHDIARHAIHVTETLDVAVETIESITKHHMMFAMPRKDDTLVDQAIAARLGFFRGYMVSMRHRSISNEKRLQNEIQLAFNTVAQYNAGTSVEITRAAQADSSAMKTIAFVTLIFLPPTFISSIFSMSFFQCGEENGWGMSDMFWMYWVFAIPITIATVMVWAYWHRLVPAVVSALTPSSPDIPLDPLEYDRSRGTLRQRVRGRLLAGSTKQDV